MLHLILPEIPLEKKWLFAGAGYALFCVLYVLTGNLHWRPPVTLVPSVIDAAIPFLAWTVWVYNSQFFFLAVNVYALRDRRNLSRTLYAMALVSLFSFCIFAAFPTTLPRTFQPGTGLTGKAFHFIYAIDSNSNCLPSLHVSLAWISATGVLRERRMAGVLACLWAAMITLSTMTTKQHYFVDVIAGLIFAALFMLFLAKVEILAPALSER